jgi:hypothetical protein
MNKAQLLQSLSNTTTYPFFGGWLVPQGNNTTLSVTLADGIQVVMDVLPSSPSDLWLRAYYRKILGNVCDAAFVDIYVANNTLVNEAAYLRGNQIKPRSVKHLNLAGVCSALNDPVTASQIFGAIAAGASATPPNVLCQLFLPLLTPTGAGLDFYDPATLSGINTLVTQGILTQAQADILDSLTVVPVTDY